MTATDPILVLDRVTRTYTPAAGPPLDVIREASLSVCAGDTVAIMGPSGSGKSTLLNLMGALDRPTAGTVRLGGADLATLGDAALAALRNRRVGFVFQFHHLLPQCTVLENVLIPALPAHNGRVPQAVGERALALLDRVGLTPRIHHPPGQLSGGECQRAAVVRALVNSPGLVLADEPTGSLDHANAQTLAALLVDLNREQKTALIVVTHSPELAARMGRRFTLEDGRLTLQQFEAVSPNMP